MMIVRTSPPSPFGRKVLIAANVLGLADQITVQKADPTDAADTLRQQNPDPG
jgi:glutathione S-transferase